MRFPRWKLSVSDVCTNSRIDVKNAPRRPITVPEQSDASLLMQQSSHSSFFLPAMACLGKSPFLGSRISGGFGYSSRSSSLPPIEIPGSSAILKAVHGSGMECSIVCSAVPTHLVGQSHFLIEITVSAITFYG
jgi:hypothetical protein